MEIDIHDIVGAIGVTLIIATYFALQAGRLETGLRYSLLNGVGAAMILYSLIFDFNLAAFLVEAFWLAISLYGIYRSLKPARQDAA